MLGVILFAGIFVIISNNKKHKEDSKKLESKFKLLQDSLISSSNKLDSLRTQILPIISIAKEKYPNIPDGDALILLGSEIADLNDQIQVNNLYSKKEVESSRPELNICDGQVNWKILEGQSKTCQIQFEICNIGERTAFSVQERFLIIICKPNNEVIDIFYPPSEFGENVDIPKGMKINRTTGNLTSTSAKTGLTSFPLEIKNRKIFFYLEYVYSDMVLEKLYSLIKVYDWEGFEKDGMKFNLSNNIDFKWVVEEVKKQNKK